MKDSMLPLTREEMGNQPHVGYIDSDGVPASENDRAWRAVTDKDIESLSYSEGAALIEARSLWALTDPACVAGREEGAKQKLAYRVWRDRLDFTLSEISGFTIDSQKHGWKWRGEILIIDLRHNSELWEIQPDGTKTLCRDNSGHFGDSSFRGD
jgi:hypothetical protein